MGRPSKVSAEVKERAVGLVLAQQDALCVFCLGGARPPTEVMVAFIDAHRDVDGVEAICAPLPIAPSIAIPAYCDIGHVRAYVDSCLRPFPHPRRRSLVRAGPPTLHLRLPALWRQAFAPRRLHGIDEEGGGPI
jgi:hypothetical protein